MSFVPFVPKKVVGFLLSELDHKKPLSRLPKIKFWSQWVLKLVTGMTQNKFIRCFHQFVALIFSMNFSQFVQQLKKKILLVQNIFFSVYQFKKKSYQIYVDSEFEIGETIGWIFSKLLQEEIWIHQSLLVWMKNFLELNKEVLPLPQVCKDKVIYWGVLTIRQDLW